MHVFSTGLLAKINENAKPVVRQGRKAAGLNEIAGLRHKVTRLYYFMGRDDEGKIIAPSIYFRFYTNI